MERRVIGGILLVVVVVLSYAKPPFGWILVCALGIWGVSVVHKPEGSSLVAQLWRNSSPTRGQHYTSGAVAFGIMLVLGMLAAAGNRADVAKAEQQIEEQRAVEEKAIENMNADLRQKAPDTTIKVSAVVKAAALALEARDDLALHNSIQEGKRLLTPYENLVPPVAELTSLKQELGTYERHLAALAGAKDALGAGAGKLQEAAALIKDGDYVAADAVYGALLAKLDVPESSAQYVSMPDVKKLRATAESKRKAIGSRVKRQQLEIAKAELYATMCGDKPVRSEWDGEIVGLERHLKEAAHDPSSIDVENCTLPVMTEERCWVSTCNVRGKNMFGAMILRRIRYSFSKLGIEEVR